MKIIKAGTKIVIHVEAGQCGTDSAEFYILTKDYPSKYLDNFAWESGLDHAATYNVYESSQCPEEPDEDDETEYSDNIEGYWEVYNPKEHDGYRVGGDDSFIEI